MTVQGARRHLPYLYVLPLILSMLLVHLTPMLSGIYTSFHRVDMFTIRRWFQAPFIGLDNYLRALDIFGESGQSFLNSVWVTLGYILVSLAGCYVLGLVAALLLSKDFPGRGLLRSLFLIPYVTPQVVGLTNLQFLFQRDYGMVNYLLLKLHLISQPVSWLMGRWSFFTLVFANVWGSWPLWFIMLLAAIQTIPQELYEAAIVDGARGWQKFRFITLPGLRSVTRILFLLSSLWFFNSFNQAYVLFGKTPPPPADLLSLHIYNLSFGTWNFGLGSAMSVLLLVIMLAFVLIYTRLLRAE